MHTLSSLMVHLAVLLVALAGLGAMVNSTLRDWCLRAAFVAFAGSLAEPIVRTFVGLITESVGAIGQSYAPVEHGVRVFAVVLGHIVVAGILLRRRLRGADASRREAQERNHDRSRRRTRVPPSDVGDAP